MFSTLEFGSFTYGGIIMSREKNETRITSKTIRNMYWTCFTVSLIILASFAILSFHQFLPGTHHDEEQVKVIYVDRVQIENYLQTSIWFVCILLSTYTILNRVGRYKLRELPERHGGIWIPIFWGTSAILFLLGCLNTKIYFTSLYWEYSTMVLMVLFGNKVVKHLKLKEIADVLKLIKFIGGQ